MRKRKKLILTHSVINKDFEKIPVGDHGTGLHFVH